MLLLELSLYRYKFSILILNVGRKSNNFNIMWVQVALVEVLKAIDIKPDFIIGHSLGENSCAYADGCLTLEQSVLASYARGVASKEVKTVKGMMAAVGR